MTHDFLSLADFDRDWLDKCLDQALALKANPVDDSLHGKSVALVFEKSSTRTRVSFTVGVAELGGIVVEVNSLTSQLARGEPIKDTARAIGGYVDAIVFRTSIHSRLEEMAEYCTKPVINGLSDLLHPCQVLADLLTVRESFGDISSCKYCWLGDGNNMAHSWINTVGVLGAELSLACPKGFEPDEGIVNSARQRGAKVTLHATPEDAAKGANVVSTDVWASMGKESEAGSRESLFAPFQLNDNVLACASADAIVLHCLPAYRDKEITASVMEGAQSRIWQQSANRKPVQKALLQWCMI